MSGQKKLLAIVGPTASGKTSLSIELAKRFHGEIVNGDSRLFYRGLDIATAKPTADERQGIPHNLIDILGPTDDFNLKSFAELAHKTIDQVTARNNLPILTGGSGQYVWSLLEGWDIPEISPNDSLRNELENQLEREGVESLAERLSELDRKVAKMTDLRNPRRVIRAMERALSDSEYSPRQKSAEPPYDSLIVGLTADRPVLHKRVSDRLQKMIDTGWEQEVRNLIDSGVPCDSKSMSGIGYRQMAGFVKGDYSLDEAVRLTNVATNRLIRHQNNWFKAVDTRIRWFDNSTGGDEFVESVAEYVSHWMDAE